MAVNNALDTNAIPISVVEGGSGDSSLTAYAPLVGGTSTTSSIQSAATGMSTAGFVFTSNGSSAVPSFKANPGQTQAQVLTLTSMGF